MAAVVRKSLTRSTVGASKRFSVLFSINLGRIISTATTVTMVPTKTTLDAGDCTKFVTLCTRLLSFSLFLQYGFPECLNCSCGFSIRA